MTSCGSMLLVWKTLLNPSSVLFSHFIENMAVGYLRDTFLYCLPPLTTRNERSALLPAIHLSRSNHIQTLDSLFPITPLHPPSLLYAILGVPLPIPIGPKDPAPPLTISYINTGNSHTDDQVQAQAPNSGGKIRKDKAKEIKVDERSTATALGYVAMVVQLLGGIASSSAGRGFGAGASPPGSGGGTTGGAGGSLAYPVTCAGSRSLVKDVVSVMQGPRS